MSNFTNSNLISAAGQQLSGTPAIKVGGIVFPLGKTDFSDATAMRMDVLAGKKYIDSAGQVQEGLIPVNSGGTITPSTSSQTVSAGVYLSGAVTVPGDANLVASNIVSGVSIFGVSGTAQAGGGPAPAEHISSGAFINEGETVAVSSGWDYQAALINNGGSMVVSSGGTGTDTAIKWNGYLTVSSGGTARNTKVISGTLVVSDGGTASDTFLLAGSMAVSNGGTATNTRVLGSNAYFSGGFADGAQIENGGYMRLSSGVSGSNILIHSGGRLDIYNPGTGAVVTSVTVSGIFDIWGGASADHVHVCSGGIMYQREGAIVTNLVVDEGGEVQ